MIQSLTQLITITSRLTPLTFCSITTGSIINYSILKDPFLVSFLNNQLSLDKSDSQMFERTNILKTIIEYNESLKLDETFP